jgi:CRISPR system Cascade subunit CasD
MATLMIRLCGPMQSWGTHSRFLVRDTGLEPSKSGVIGLICAALGKPRQEKADDGLPALAELAALKMAVRADRPGSVRLDYHTAGGTRSTSEEYGVVRADGSGLGPVVSRRYFLADAEFLVGLEGPSELLRTIAHALEAPRWHLFFGRKSHVPSAPLLLPASAPWRAGWREDSLEQALRECPWLGELDRPGRGPRPEQLRIVIDDPTSTETRRDVPLSFSARRFGVRRVRTDWVPCVSLKER